jgi:GNAT superfamily N-acetyltransferase
MGKVSIEPVSLAQTDEEIARCFPVMAFLRPSLPKAEFLDRIRTQQEQGYMLAFLEDEREVVAVAGFRIMEKLCSGRTLYVDDLVTDETRRSRGYGKAMLDWLQDYGRTAGCATFALESGTWRHDAHAFYFRERLRVTDFHFEKKL